MTMQDLQIGDLLDYRGQIIKVTSLYAKNGSTEVGFGDKEDRWVDISVLKPIFLTDEILHKNFDYFSLHKRYVLTDDYFDIDIRQYSELQWVFCYHNTEMNIPDTGIAGIGYVHHLQHALRMVGVEKEIII